MIPTSRPESRRAMLALIAAPAGPDAGFSAAYARMLAIEAEWNAPGAISMADDDIFAAHYRVAQISMLVWPATTAAAIQAKWRHCDGDEVALPSPFDSSTKVIEDDLARLASREVRA